MGKKHREAATGADGPLMTWLSRLHVLACVLTAAIAALAHLWENLGYYRHLQKIADNDMQAVSSLQTENGFYYSFYREMTDSSFVEGLGKVIFDTRSEYPDQLNAIRRFNIYQEVIMAAVYWTLRTCGFYWIRAWDLFKYSVIACNSIGFFALCLLSAEMGGSVVAVVGTAVLSFLNRFQIGRLGNYTSVNLREMWALPVLWVQIWCLWRLLQHAQLQVAGRWVWRLWLFSTFAFLVLWQFSPFLLLLQLTALYFAYLVCGYRHLRSAVERMVDGYLVALVLASLVQFASPYLLTSPFFFQLIALKVAMQVMKSCQQSGDVVAKRSGSWHQRMAMWTSRRVVAVVEGVISLIVFVLIREAFSKLEWSTADTHVYEILCTKVKIVNDVLPSFAKLPPNRLPECAEPSFNAKLYLIMGVFKEIEAKSLVTFRETGASAATILMCCVVGLRFLVSSFIEMRSPSSADKPLDEGEDEEPVAASAASAQSTGLRRRKGAESKPAPAASEAKKQKSTSRLSTKMASGEEAEHAAWRYEEAALMVMVLQFALFFALGCLINRLRAAFGPLMMLLAACCFGARVWQPRMFLQGSLAKVASASLLLLQLAQVAWLAQRLPCVSGSEGVCFHLEDRTSTNGDTIDLIDWMNRNLDPRLPVLCSMGTSGQMRAFTDNPLIVHPQFESENLRKRVQTAYEMYHCGSEESFAETVKELGADVVIFEYYRCFITPYTLDDKSKNCDKSRHKSPDDLLCYKLHSASTKYFELIFANAGYAVFALRRNGDAAITAEAEDPRFPHASYARWKQYIARCAEEQGAECAGRLGEVAATWSSDLKKKKEAAMLRTLARERFPDDPYLAYTQGRYLDWDAKQPVQAGALYAEAAAKLPNNPLVLKEYLMWLDLSAKDTQTIRKLLQDRSADRGRGAKPLLELRGPGVAGLFCEAAVSAQTVNMKDLARKLWTAALDMSPLSNCIKTNWPAMEHKREYDKLYTEWHRVNLLVSVGTDHTINVHNSPGIRFTEGGRFLLLPNRTRRRT